MSEFVICSLGLEVFRDELFALWVVEVKITKLLNYGKREGADCCETRIVMVIRGTRQGISNNVVLSWCVMNFIVLTH